jgi:hypothetical protein
MHGRTQSGVDIYMSSNNAILTDEFYGFTIQTSRGDVWLENSRAVVPKNTPASPLRLTCQPVTNFCRILSVCVALLICLLFTNLVCRGNAEADSPVDGREGSQHISYQEPSSGILRVMLTLHIESFQWCTWSEKAHTYISCIYYYMS